MDQVESVRGVVTDFFFQSPEEEPLWFPRSLRKGVLGALNTLERMPVMSRGCL